MSSEGSPGLGIKWHFGLIDFPFLGRRFSMFTQSLRQLAVMGLHTKREGASYLVLRRFQTISAQCATQKILIFVFCFVLPLQELELFRQQPLAFNERPVTLSRSLACRQKIFSKSGSPERDLWSASEWRWRQRCAGKAT